MKRSRVNRVFSGGAPSDQGRGYRRRRGVVPGERTHNGANHPIRHRQAMEGDRHWLGCQGDRTAILSKTTNPQKLFGSHSRQIGRHFPGSCDRIAVTLA
jgi:hypothetical protein